MSTLKATTLSNLAGDKTIPLDRVAQGVAAAWVNFNGTGTVAIRASYNVSSITDNGTGNYTVNLTTALSDTDYCVYGSAGSTSPNFNLGVYSTGKAVGSIQVGVHSTANTQSDVSEVSVAIHS